MKIVIISIAGMLGVLSRYFLGTWIQGAYSPGWPLGTLLINLTGCFLIGLVASLPVAEPWLTADLRLALTVGFLGGFTTFSSYCYEALQLFTRGAQATALAYIVLSPVLGLALAFCGTIVGRKLL